MGKGGNAVAVPAIPKVSEVLIDGRFYDVTSFKHPGGSVIKFLAGSGADATPTYNEFHTRSKKADKFLKSLPSRSATSEEVKQANELSKLLPGDSASPTWQTGASPLTDLAKVETQQRLRCFPRGTGRGGFLQA